MLNLKQRRPWAWGCGLLLGTSLVVANVMARNPGTLLAESDSRPALTAEQSGHAAILSVVEAGQRLVAVGERGLVLWSDDRGQHWQQAQVPVSVTLTSATFINNQEGWAAGHYGLVLHTRDGGQSWEVQLDGKRAAGLVLEAVEARVAAADATDRRAQRSLANAKRLVEDGPDKPFLDIHFRNEREGLVVGAYGLIFATTDGGQHWQPLNGHLDNPGERHLYSITETNGRLFLAGEEGLLFRSLATDSLTFERLETSYDGSFFTISAHRNELVVAGLRGNAFHSEDGGDSWQELHLPSGASVIASDFDADGNLLMVNQAGLLMAGNPAVGELRLLPTPPVVAPTSLLRVGQRSLLLSGLQGLAQVAVPADNRARN